MKVETGVGGGWLGGVAAEAKRLEGLGYNGLVVAELNHEITTHWTLACAATERVEVGTSVMIAFPRSPFVVAQQAWELQELTHGRVNLGLGPQVKGHNEQRFSTGKWVPPAPRLEEYVRMVRAVWDTYQTGAKPDFAGKYYQFRLCPPQFNLGPLPYPKPKVFISTVGPAMARVAGRTCDGVRIHPFCTDRYIREVVIPNVRAGAAQAGRDLADFEFAGGGMMALGETESEAEQQTQQLRRMVAFYGSTRTYHPVLALHGYEDIGMQLHEMSLQNRWGEMNEAVTDNMLHDIVTTSTYDRLPSLLKTRSYLSRTSLAYGGEAPKDEERLRWLIGEVQRIETRGVAAA